MSGEWSGGKGSKPRKMSVSRQQYADNYDRIFRKDKQTNTKDKKSK